MNIDEIIDKIKNSALELDLDQRLDVLKGDLQSVSEKAIDKSMNYIIKSIPMPDAIRDVVKDVKEAIKTRQLREVIGTAVNSSVREGLEISGVSKDNINSLKDMKKFALKGGLIILLKNGIEIVENKFLKNNIVGEYVYNFFAKLKNYILSNEFLKKINSMVDKLTNKKDEYLEKCEDWYEAYSKMDIVKMNKISEELDSNSYITVRYEDCKRENNIIQNMTKMVNAKKGELSLEQQKLCEAM